MASTVVQTRYGKVEGTHEGSIFTWKGIPYAQAPIGSLRFRAPQSPESWDGIRDATKFGSICVQVPNPLSQADGMHQSEDCLNLNVWSPAADGKRRPVMVWIHGGAFVFGSGQSPWYDGTSFALEGDVVVVTINYRLGPFGFLYLDRMGGGDYASSGNCALLDQVAALQWVQENIAAFGGDPNRVTLFGESAGSMSVGALLTMPAAKGLFHQAIMESGLPIPMRDGEAAHETTQHVLAALQVEEEALETLQKIPAHKILEAAETIPAGRGLTWRPVLDGTAIPQSFETAIEAGAAMDIPVIIGCNWNELTLWTVRDPIWRQVVDDDERVQTFAAQWGAVAPEAARFYLDGKNGQAMLDALTQMGSYRAFGAPIQTLATRQVGKAPVWVYRFDWQSRAGNGALKACHALEIPFVFNTIDHPSAMALTGDAPDRQTVANQMHHAWIAFAKTGNPNTEEIPDWPPYDLEDRPTMIFNTKSHVENDPYGDERILWEHIFGK